MRGPPSRPRDEAAPASRRVGAARGHGGRRQAHRGRRAARRDEGLRHRHAGDPGGDDRAPDRRRLHRPRRPPPHADPEGHPGHRPARRARAHAPADHGRVGEAARSRWSAAPRAATASWATSSASPPATVTFLRDLPPEDPLPSAATSSITCPRCGKGEPDREPQRLRLLDVESPRTPAAASSSGRRSRASRSPRTSCASSIANGRTKELPGFRSRRGRVPRHARARPQAARPVSSSSSRGPGRRQGTGRGRRGVRGGRYRTIRSMTQNGSVPDASAIAVRRWLRSHTM